jgi:hypothetical protein
MTEILYRIATNDERFNAWAKKKKKNLEGAFLEMFNFGYNESVNGGHHTRLTFVCYWEINENGSLAKVAPAITQACLMLLGQRLLERNKMNEVELVSNMSVNFARLLGILGAKDEEE